MSRSSDITRNRQTAELPIEALEQVTGGAQTNLKGAERELGRIIGSGLSFAGNALAGAGGVIFANAANASPNPHQL
jgi:hypothetical protein